MSVRHALLALLSEGPKYGLQLRTEFEERTGDVWPLNGGQVYSTLQRLERDGLIVSSDADAPGPQQNYQLTSAGEIELTQWLTRPPDLSEPPRNEIVMKVMVAAGIRGIEVADVIQVHRRYMIELMQEWTHLKSHDDGDDVNFSLVADAELFRLDAMVHWLDAAEVRLAAAKREATSEPVPVIERGLPLPRRQAVRR
jgi:DNA-binding PadR family transcriptional regulator